MHLALARDPFDEKKKNGFPVYGKFPSSPLVSIRELGVSSCR